MTKTSLSKEVWVGWVSSLAEAYNMAIYSFIAPLLAKFIFQQESLILSYALLTMGTCFFYPAGAFYYGFLGDKKGRQKTCMYSTLGLSFATGLMGFVPFSSGSWIYFLVLISAQHFFSGGEYHGSIVFSLEHAKLKNSGLMSALSCLFAVFGLVIANGFATFALVSKHEAWIRICFFAGGIGGLISYFLKNHCSETPAFIALSHASLEDNLSWRLFMKTHWLHIARAVSVFAFFIVVYTFIFILIPLMPFKMQQFATFKSLISYGLLLVASGLIADRLGIRKIMLAGLFLFCIVLIPACYFIKNICLLQILLTICASLVIGPIHSWMLEQFDAQNRCRGIFISSAIAISIFGGSTVPICLMIYESSHSFTLCSLYPFIVALGSLSFLIFNKKPKVVFV